LAAIVYLHGNSISNWPSFQDEICQTHGFSPKSRLKIVLTDIQSEITSPKQLQINDKIVVFYQEG